MSTVKRIFVEKKEGFDVAAQHLFGNLKNYIGIGALEAVRILIRYDIEDINDETYELGKNTIFAEPPVDRIFDETVELASDEHSFAVEYLPGQYDQRADSAAQCIQIMAPGTTPKVKAAQVIILKGNLTAQDIEKAKSFLINPVDSHEASLDKPETLQEQEVKPSDVPSVEGFIDLDADGVEKQRQEMGLAMSHEDFLHCQNYFANEEKRNPTLTEIKMLDTYWSDHCRHTTFLTQIDSVSIDDGKLNNPVKASYEEYQKVRQELYASPEEKPECLMDIAVAGMKEMRKKGTLDDLEVSDEINACSIVVEADINGEKEDWLVMFKNETHNHPTEIEPFGGAATCLGGAIRDPLSGRSYVYQAMRVTGSGDPRKSQDETIPGKLPQRKITTEAAHGYSSYGNQIGLATGHVAEIYHEGYTAKRMEVGAVIAASPKENVFRGKPAAGDVVILVGGRTGRDGCGGATGSSKAHTEESITTSGAEVQKGNAPTERKIQRLFRIPEVSKMIKKCNDFGAGGVSVAIGELADGLLIDLDTVPKKYDSLDGTELAISESQERMAVVLDPKDVDAFKKFSDEENLEATEVALVTEEARVKIMWQNKCIVDLSRAFIETNGVRQHTTISVQAPAEDENYFNKEYRATSGKENITEAVNALITDLNICSQKGLVERFDSTIGVGTVNLPFGGKYQLTPTETMTAKLPLVKGETTTGTTMSWGFNPELSDWSPYHGAQFAVIESIAKLIATGVSPEKIRLSFQEYFEKLGTDAYKWGKPFAALLGALTAQRAFAAPAIGGKDSMSGTFENISVPPTLISFAVSAVDVDGVISPELKDTDSSLVYLKAPRHDDETANFDKIKAMYDRVHHLIQKGVVRAAHTVSNGGLVAALVKMSVGNKIGFTLNTTDRNDLFGYNPGSLLLEISSNEDSSVLDGIDYTIVGTTNSKSVVTICGVERTVDSLLELWETPLDSVFPRTTTEKADEPPVLSYTKRNTNKPSLTTAKPRVIIPVFPGTNCEYDTARAFENAGAIAETFIIRNLTPEAIEESIQAITTSINNSQMLMIPGGFSAGDEPDGSGKFIAAVFKNPRIRDAINNLVKERDGLVLGICNGFQALIKLGLLPHGEVCDITENDPTLTFNTIGRHVSAMVNTRVSSVLSPWLSKVNVGDIHTIPVSHGEGRFYAKADVLEKLIENGQVATQYVNLEGNPTMANINGNPNGSVYSIEGLCSPDGRVLGKMGHSERHGDNVGKNIVGNKYQPLFEGGVAYFS